MMAICVSSIQEREIINIVVYVFPIATEAKVREGKQMKPMTILGKAVSIHLLLYQ